MTSCPAHGQTHDSVYDHNSTRLVLHLSILNLGSLHLCNVPGWGGVLMSCMCEGISLLGYWQEVNQSPTQTKPYNTLPPFEQRDSWSSYGAVRAYSEVLYILWGPRESDLSGS